MARAVAFRVCLGRSDVAPRLLADIGTVCDVAGRSARARKSVSATPARQWSREATCLQHNQSRESNPVQVASALDPCGGSGGAQIVGYYLGGRMAG
jgi:hypothetical protein